MIDTCPHCRRPVPPCEAVAYGRCECCDRLLEIVEEIAELATAPPGVPWSPEWYEARFQQIRTVAAGLKSELCDVALLLENDPC